MAGSMGGKSFEADGNDGWAAVLEVNGEQGRTNFFKKKRKVKVSPRNVYWWKWELEG